MKNPILIHVLHMSKLFTYAFLIQCLTMSLLFAWNGSAQVKSIEEVMVRVPLKGVSAQDAFKEIEGASDFNFVYLIKEVRNLPPIFIEDKSQSIYDVLVEIALQTRLEFKQINQNIHVQKSKRPQPLEPILVLEERIAVSGTVTDENGAPMPGVTVIVEGTNTGTVTDLFGNYTIEVPEGGQLVFSFLGYESVTIDVENQTLINLTMIPVPAQLDEVVVTAFGIEKEKRQLVYSTQEVEGKDISAVGNTSLLNGLQGKIAGVSVNLNSGMPGKSPDIRIRGYRSLTGGNAPLYIIDGMPVSGDGRQVDLNPNDIENINVLKGQAASALYGLRAANGVIVITTKSGKSSQTPTFTFDTHYNMDKAAYYPKVQKEYAQGLDGVFDPNSIWTWGPRISGLGTYTNQLGEQEQAASYDHQKDFYQTGNTINTNLTFANGNDAGNFLLGIGHTHQTGIVPNTDLTRINVKLNGELNLTENFTVTAALNYADLGINDFPETFGNDNFFRGLIETPPSYNLAGKPYSSPDNPYHQIFYRASQNNPYWVINNNFREESTRRTFGNTYFKYDLGDYISLNYRIGIDHYSTNRTVHRELGDGPAGRNNPPRGGQLTLNNSFSTQFNSNFFISYSQNVAEDFDIDLILGNEIYDVSSNNNNTTGSNYLVGGWPSLANTTLVTANNNKYRNRIVGFYGNINLGWRDMLFLNASARNDVVSNMLSQNRSFLYPSVGTSFILTEAIPQLERALSYAKVRATYAEVGQAGPLYVNDRGFRAFSPGGFIFPYQGLGSWTQNTTRVNPDLRPENTKSLELGVDFRFLNDRIGIDYTYYKNKSEGQIFAVPIPVTTGATSEIRNAGELLSYGHEAMLSLSLFESRSFNWFFNTNFSTYKNQVKRLYGDTDRVIITAADGISLVAEVGQTYPAFLGTSHLRDPDSGQIVIESNPELVNTYGLPLQQTIPTILGTPNPDFEVNFINDLSIKSFSLSFQVDWRQGGFIFSQSLTEAIRRGLAPITLEREEDVVIEGKKGTMVEGALAIDGDNDIVIKKDFRWASVMHGMRDYTLQDASFIRLREVSLGYDLPPHIVNRIFAKSASLFITGRNLFLITDAFVDPELNTSEGFASTNTAGIEWSQVPQTKSYGAGIRLTF